MALVKVPVTKGKGFIEIDTSDGVLPDAVYQEALVQGLKVLLNRGMTKITKETYPVPAELQAAAMAKATETYAAMKAGKIRIVGVKSSDGKVSGAVMTEARRLARNLVKDAMKREGIKVSYVEASEITKAANALIAADPEIIEQAKAEIAARDAQKEKVTTAIDIKSIPQSAKKIKAAEEAKAAAKSTLSAAKAGKIKSKPVAQANA